MQTVTNPVALGAAVVTKSMEAGSKVNDAVSATKLVANPKEALKNPVDAALTVKAAKELVTAGYDRAKSLLQTHARPPAPAAPKTPGCEVAGACHK